MSNLPLFAALACSLAIIACLWHGDPKRRRVARLQAIGHGIQARRVMAAAGILPGAILALSGNSAAFLIWLGACAMAGWLVAQVR